MKASQYNKKVSEKKNDVMEKSSYDEIAGNLLELLLY